MVAIVDGVWTYKLRFRMETFQGLFMPCLVQIEGVLSEFNDVLFK